MVTLKNGAELTICEKSLAKYGDPPQGFAQFARNEPYEGENLKWALDADSDGNWVLWCKNCPTACYEFYEGSWHMNHDV